MLRFKETLLLCCQTDRTCRSWSRPRSVQRRARRMRSCSGTTPRASRTWSACKTASRRQTSSSSGGKRSAVQGDMCEMSSHRAAGLSSFAWFEIDRGNLTVDIWKQCSILHSTLRPPLNTQLSLADALPCNAHSIRAPGPLAAYPRCKQHHMYRPPLNVMRRSSQRLGNAADASRGFTNSSVPIANCVASCSRTAAQDAPSPAGVK